MLMRDPKTDTSAQDEDAQHEQASQDVTEADATQESPEQDSVEQQPLEERVAYLETVLGEVIANLSGLAKRVNVVTAKVAERCG